MDNSARMCNFIIDNHTLLRQPRPCRVLAFLERISFIRSLAFSHAHVKKTFKEEFKQAQMIADAFDLVENGVSHDARSESRNSSSGGNGLKRMRSSNSNGRNRGTSSIGRQSKIKTERKIALSMSMVTAFRAEHKTFPQRLYRLPRDLENRLLRGTVPKRAKDGPAANT